VVGTSQERDKYAWLDCLTIVNLIPVAEPIYDVSRLNWQDSKLNKHKVQLTQC